MRLMGLYHYRNPYREAKVTDKFPDIKIRASGKVQNKIIYTFRIIALCQVKQCIQPVGFAEKIFQCQFLHCRIGVLGKIKIAICRCYEGTFFVFKGGA